MIAGKEGTAKCGPLGEREITAGGIVTTNLKDDDRLWRERRDGGVEAGKVDTGGGG